MLLGSSARAEGLGGGHGKLGKNAATSTRIALTGLLACAVRLRESSRAAGAGAAATWGAVGAGAAGTVGAAGGSPLYCRAGALYVTLGETKTSKANSRAPQTLCPRSTRRKFSCPCGTRGFSSNSTRTSTTQMPAGGVSLNRSFGFRTRAWSKFPPHSSLPGAASSMERILTEARLTTKYPGSSCASAPVTRLAHNAIPVRRDVMERNLRRGFSWFASVILVPHYPLLPDDLVSQYERVQLLVHLLLDFPTIPR